MRRFIYDLAYDETNIGPISVDFQLTVHIDTEVIESQNGNLDGTGNFVDPSIADPNNDFEDHVITTTQVVDGTLSKTFTRAALTAGITNNGNDLSGANPWTIPDNKFVVFRSEPFQYDDDLSPNDTVSDAANTIPTTGNQIYNFPYPNLPYPYAPNLWSHFGNLFNVSVPLRDINFVPQASLAYWYFSIPSNLSIVRTKQDDFYQYTLATAPTTLTTTYPVLSAIPMGNWTVERATAVNYPLPSSPTTYWTSNLYQFPPPPASGTITTPVVDYNVSTLRKTDGSSLTGTYTYNRPQPNNNPGFLYHKKWEWEYVFTVTVT